MQEVGTDGERPREEELLEDGWLEQDLLAESCSIGFRADEHGEVGVAELREREKSETSRERSRQSLEMDITKFCITHSDGAHQSESMICILEQKRDRSDDEIDVYQLFDVEFC